MRNIDVTHLVRRRHLFALGGIAATIAAFSIDNIRPARLEHPRGAGSSESHASVDSAIDSNEWADFDKSG